MNIKKNVAFIGLGTMGYPMAGHLSKSNLFNLRVYNRSSQKATEWSKEYEGEVSNSIKEVVMDADFVVTCTGKDEDMMEIVFSDQGVITYLKKGSIFIDHTTTSADLAKNLANEARLHECGFIDAPVSGGQQGAEGGQLTVMCGGSVEDFAKIESVVACFSKAVTLMGPTGSGQLCKMVNQICIAGLVQGLAEGLNFAQRAGLDAHQVVDVISKGAAQSWQMENRYKTMLAGEYEHGFAVEWMRKDLSFALEEAKTNGSALPVAQLVDQYYAEVEALGGNRWDTSSLLARLQV